MIDPIPAGSNQSVKVCKVQKFEPPALQGYLLHWKCRAQHLLLYTSVTWHSRGSTLTGYAPGLTDWADCFQSGPAPKGPSATPTNLRKLTLSVQPACVAPARAAGPTVFFKRGSCCQRKSKWIASFLNNLIHHNSFWNRNSGHCFSMCCLVVSVAG